ncbi:MAG: adenylate/guanylate cyclase domain-containing protein [Solirubrobacteraceae bacterium]
MRDTARRVDSQPGLLAAASWLRSRLPGDDRYGDPLSTAGENTVDLLARQVSAMQPSRPSVTGQVGLGALQLWQSLSEASGRGRGTREVTLLFTDLVGFSSWALRAGDEAALDLLRLVGTAVERSIEDRQGRIVKRLGDGVMAAFLEPQDAVESALTALERLTSIEVAGHRPQMRAGVHHGRPRKLGGDYLGVDVNIAARVGAAAKADQLLVSEPTWERLPRDAYKAGRAKPLRAAGAPKELRVRVVSRGG